jgi:hypothetical protein
MQIERSLAHKMPIKRSNDPDKGHREWPLRAGAMMRPLGAGARSAYLAERARRRRRRLSQAHSPSCCAASIAGSAAALDRPSGVQSRRRCGRVPRRSLGYSRYRGNRGRGRWMLCVRTRGTLEYSQRVTKYSHGRRASTLRSSSVIPSWHWTTRSARSGGSSARCSAPTLTSADSA